MNNTKFFNYYVILARRSISTLGLAKFTYIH